MFNAVGNFCNNYYQQLPDDGLKSAGLSAMGSFLASATVICMKSGYYQMQPDFTRAGLAAGVTFAAAIIHTITTPIFNYLFDNPNNQFNGFYEFAKFSMTVYLTHFLINHATAFKINLVSQVNFQYGKFNLIPSNLIWAELDVIARVFHFFGSNAFNFHYNKPNSTPYYFTI